MQRTLVVLLFGLTLTACSKDNGEASLGCDDTRTELTFEQSSDLGFSGAEVVAALAKTYNETLTWSDDISTDLTIGLAYSDGAVHYIHSVPAEGSQELGAASLCEDRVEIELTVSFVTGDGAFNETWELPVEATAVDAARLYQELDVDNLSGTYDFRELNPSEFDEVKAFLSVGFDASGSYGAVSEQGSKVEGETASATIAEVAEWGAAGE